MPEPLSQEEIRQLISVIPARSTAGIRLRAIIGVLYGCGARLNETLNLQTRDIDLQQGAIRIRFGKRKPRKNLDDPPNPYRVRTVGIDPDNAAHLARWMDKRPELGLTARHPLFATYTAGNVGRKLDPRYVRAALARAAQRAGMEKRVHPHGMRHSFASKVARRLSPTIVQAQLGHSSLVTTQRYIAELSPWEVIEAVRDWPAAGTMEGAGMSDPND